MSVHPWPDCPGSRAQGVPVSRAAQESPLRRGVGGSGISPGAHPAFQDPQASMSCPLRLGSWTSHCRPHSLSKCPGPCLLATPWVPPEHGQCARNRRPGWAGTTASPSVHRVNRCGFLFCEGGQKSPEKQSCTLTTFSATCQALVLSGGPGYEPVPEGTMCGEKRVSDHSTCHACTSASCSSWVPEGRGQTGAWTCP